MKNTLRTIAMMLVAALVMTACGKDKYTIKVESNNTSWGTTTGSGEYEKDAVVKISGTPVIGFKFLRWEDGPTENPREITVTGDAVYRAIFADVNADEPSEGGDDTPDIPVDPNMHCTVTFGDTTWDAGVMFYTYFSEQGAYSIGAYVDAQVDGPFVSFSCQREPGTYNYQAGKYMCYYQNGSEDVLEEFNGQNNFPHWFTATSDYKCVITEFDATYNLISGEVDANLLNMFDAAAEKRNPEFRKIHVDFYRFYMQQYQQN